MPGIPLGLANFKIIPISLVPLGVRIVPSDEPVRLEAAVHQNDGSSK